VTTASSDPLLRFYRLEGTDARGRTLEEIWTWEAGRLEAVHDYIQWLFPLPEPSAFNPHAPILTAEAIAEFRGDEQLRQRLLRSLTLMLGFYGLELTTDPGGRPQIVLGAAFPTRGRAWLRVGDHNHLRLTRILTSLRLLGLEAHSTALYQRLAAIARDHPHAVSTTTLGYWQRTTS
jgi:hypothetical protein